MIKQMYFALTLRVTLWPVDIYVNQVVHNFCLSVCMSDRNSTDLPQILIEEIGRITKILGKFSFPEKLGSQAI